MHAGIKQALGWTAAGAAAVTALRAVVRHGRLISLRGRTVLITGGSRGLGLVLARTLGHEGARLAICARDPAEVQRATADLAAEGFEVLGFACDVTERSQVEWTVAQILAEMGPIDVLINNAGTIQVGPFEVTTLEDYEQAFRTHFWGPFFTTLAVLPGMRQRGMGRIVNVSSIGGKISVPHLLPYSASKFALTGFSEGLRAELVKDGIYVTTVIPGLMRTGSPPNAQFKGQHRAEYAWFSLSDSLPIVSMSAESAAQRIVTACKYGDAEVILSLPAQLAVRFHGMFPDLTPDLLGLVNLLLPGPGGVGTRSVKGRDSSSAVSPSWATVLTDTAAARNNEM